MDHVSSRHWPPSTSTEPAVPTNGHPRDNMHGGRAEHSKKYHYERVVQPWTQHANIPCTTPRGTRVCPGARYELENENPSAPRAHTHKHAHSTFFALKPSQAQLATLHNTPRGTRVCPGSRYELENENPSAPCAHTHKHTHSTFSLSGLAKLSWQPLEAARTDALPSGERTAATHADMSSTR